LAEIIGFPYEPTYVSTHKSYIRSVLDLISLNEQYYTVK